MFCFDYLMPKVLATSDVYLSDGSAWTMLSAAALNIISCGSNFCHKVIIIMILFL